MKSAWSTNQILGFCLLLALGLMSPQRARAHAGLLASPSVAPRSTSTGLKTAPCGGLMRSASPKVATAGSTITVQWQETINHPGRFEFYFSRAGEQGWQLLKTVTDTQDNNNLPHMYTTTLTLPPENCTDCTLQMIQVMTENPAAPTYYYSCADFQLQGGASAPASQPAANCP